MAVFKVWGVLGGSWVVISRVISRVTILMTHTGLNRNDIIYYSPRGPETSISLT